VTSVSAVVLTLNEEENIADCLDALSWADELLVIDSFSQDDTGRIAAEKGAEVRRREFDDYASQRNAGLSMASGEWVFFVDADERVTTELADEVRKVVEDEGLEGWWVPRKNYIFGKWIRHAGWYPDYQLRLVRRQKARYDERHPVHELVVLEGEAGFLQNPLIHFNYGTVREFAQKQNRYTDLEVRMLRESGVRAKPWNLVLQPLRQFSWRYITLRGYRDGWRGLVLSVLLGYYEIVRYWRLSRGQGDSIPDRS
jgi:(heptosyl)LPS beta-1,4-glucosyltransferase